MKRRRVGEPGAASVFRLGLRGDKETKPTPKTSGRPIDIGSRLFPVPSETTYIQKCGARRAVENVPATRQNFGPICARIPDIVGKYVV